MKIVHHNPEETKSMSLNSLRGGKEFTDILQSAEMELLYQMSEAFTVINGGQFKRRRQSA